MSGRTARDRFMKTGDREDRSAEGHTSGDQVAENPEDEDADDDGLFLGFEHRMNTDERRQMREREEEEAKVAERQRRTRSSSPSAPGNPSSYFGSTRSTQTSTYSRYSTSRTASERASHEIKSTTRRSTAYSRELEKRERARDRIRGDPSRRTSETSEASSSRVGPRSGYQAGSTDGAPVRSVSKPPATSPERTTYTVELDRPSKSPRPANRGESPNSRLSRHRSRSPGSHHRHRSGSPSSRYRLQRSGSPGSRYRRHRSGSPGARYRRRSRSPSSYSRSSAARREEERDRRREERRSRDEEGRRTRREEGKGEEDLVSTRSRTSRYRDKAEEQAELAGTEHSSEAESRRSAKDPKARTSRSLRMSEPETPRSLRRADIGEHLNSSVETEKDWGETPRETTTKSPLLSSKSPLISAKSPLLVSKSLTSETEETSHSRGRSRGIDISSPSATEQPILSRDRLRTRILNESGAENSSQRLRSRSHLETEENQKSPVGSGSATLLARNRETGDTAAESSERGSESESGSEDEFLKESEEDSSDEADSENWTVRVCLISATELPNNIVPNMPLCPVLKFGLVSVPEDEAESLIAESASEGGINKESPKSSISQKIEQDGLASFKKARVRCTSTKILSKRDNGNLEFHEEMRWDKVKKPTRTALAVELGARAALPPPNIHESPPLSAPESSINTTESTLGSATGISSSVASAPLTLSRDRSGSSQAKPTGGGIDYDDLYQKALGKRAANVDLKDSTRSNASTTSSTGGDSFGINSFMNKYNSQQAGTPAANERNDIEESEEQNAPTATGIAGMRALWRKGRQQFEQRQAAKRKSTPGDPETAQAASAAAAVARFLIRGPSEGEQPGSLPEGQQPINDLKKTEPSRPNNQGDHSQQGTILSDSTTRALKRPLAQPPLQQEDENVALVRPKKRRKIGMSQDLRLGSLVIPLARLPLAKATGGSAAARIEQWYQIDTITNAIVAKGPGRRAIGTTASKLSPRRNPSILLEISFSSPQVLDESEDELEIESEDENAGSSDVKGQGSDSKGEKRSFSRRTSVEMRLHQKGGKTTTHTPSNEDRKPEQKKKLEDPVLEPGVVDFVAVVGAGNIGDQRDDDGSPGWVNSNPDISILEQFPPSDDFHYKHGRNVTLQTKAEWFCFPEGCKPWRGSAPPTHSDLNLKRYPGSSPANVAASVAAFDACLNCATSFSWFVIQSNEKENDFKNLKTYGTVIKFYAQAPSGIDPTQDDYAQAILAGQSERPERLKQQTSNKRLWIPLGILMTSNVPIVGTLEAMLLRLCEELARTCGPIQSTNRKRLQQFIHQDIANLIVNFQKPIPGVLHCSIPFLKGERLHLTLPPPTGLPPLPHGASVTSVCRLLGSEGLTVLLAAVLTECKVLIHSDDIANLPMVAEVVTALIYPFVWSLPYLPVLPEAMMEFIEAPLSYFIGIPSCNMKIIEDEVLVDIVVIDLDNGFTTPDYYDGRRGGRPSKNPTPLPASVASNISKAVFRLLRAEEEVEEEYGANNFPGSRSLPRLEDESQAEREFRIAVALQICGLVRGYDDCLFKVSASQPVFNRDKFLRTAPALFEDRRANLPTNSGGGSQQRMLSPRSKRFLSLLVNCQHFHQFLESLDLDECAFFNEVMYTFDMHDDRDDANQMMGHGSSKLEDAASHLSKALQKVEDKIPTYRVDRKGKKKKRAGGGWEDDDDEEGIHDMIDARAPNNEIGFSDEGNLISSFTSDMLQKVTREACSGNANESQDFDDSVSVSSAHSGEIRSVSVEMLEELEKCPWRYNKLFDIPLDGDEASRSALVEVREKTKLRDAIGDRRYRAWKLAQEQKLVANDTSGGMFRGDDISSPETNTALDLTSLLSQVSDDATADTVSLTNSSVSSVNSRKLSTLSPEQQRVADAKDRDVLRRCLERAYEGGSQRRPARFGRRPSLNHPSSSSSSTPSSDAFFENGRDLIADAEAALRNPSAQKFLVSVLSQRSRLENQRKRRHGHDDAKSRRQAGQSSVSRLEPPAFDCLVRLCCAMLDACLETKNYEAGYSLLNHTQGFCTVQSKDGKLLSRKESEHGNDQGTKVVHMTARISLHPIFADLDLWEHVLQLHLKDRENDKNTDQNSETKTGSNAANSKENADVAAYDATVSTLYEMLGFCVPAEELARFATRVSEQRGWFSSERGHSLLMLARRLSAKREHGDDGAGNAGDLDMMRSGKGQSAPRAFGADFAAGSDMNGVDEDVSKFEWSEIGWCHPAALSATRPSSQSSGDSEDRSVERSGRSSQTLLNMIGSEGRTNARDERIDDSKYLKRSAVTSLASFGSSIIASGGLDGSVFVAHTILPSSESVEKEDVVHGVRLDWGSSGSRSIGAGSSSMDGEYGVGAVSCLAAAKGAGYRGVALASTSSTTKDVVGKTNHDDVLQVMEGCRVVAGTTGGDLRVWSIKDVYAATVLARKGSEDGPSSELSKPMGEMRTSHGSDGLSSSYVPRPRKGSLTEIAAGSAFTRLKYSLRGRALSGHRGGVSCIDVPSHIYRPDALVTGGADGFIKLWSLRAPTGRRVSTELVNAQNSPLFNTSTLVGNSGTSESLGQGRTKGSRGGDALSILSGHNGRVLCVKTAWHGDRLLSGGADRTVRIWDLATGGGGKCLHSFTGHLGWVTHTHYWGPNTIVSASTDRAIALWDARVGKAPLFVLRYHQSPISDLLVGSRTDPLMVSAAGDGTVATWDFRLLSASNSAESISVSKSSGEKSTAKSTAGKKAKAIRNPAAMMTGGRKTRQSGAVLLTRGAGRQKKTVVSVGADAITREWEIATGRLVREEASGHCDVISSLHTFADSSTSASSGVEPDANSSFGGTITSSWDGTIRLKKLVRR